MSKVVYKVQPTADIVIFDIDGTLADAEHRLHYIRGGKDSGKRDWKSFFSEAKNDEPIQHTLNLNRMYQSRGYDAYLVTGRPDNLRKDTEKWLAKAGVYYVDLIMRPATDRRADFVSKREAFLAHPILKEAYSKGLIECVFEDRLQVAKMWRELGLPVLLCGDEWLKGDWSE